MSDNKKYNSYNEKYNNNYIWYQQEWGKTVDDYHSLNKEVDWFKEQWGGTTDKSRAFKEEQKSIRSSNYSDKLKESLDKQPYSRLSESKVSSFIKENHPDFNTNSYSNNDRYNIVNSYMERDDFKNNNQTIKQNRKITDHFSNYSYIGNDQKNFVKLNETGRPEIYNRSQIDKLKDSSLSLFDKAKSKFNEFSRRATANNPDNLKDMLTMSAIGGETTQTKMGKAASLMGMSGLVGAEFTGYNPITKGTMNIDYLSNRIGRSDNYKPISDKDNRFSASLKNRYNKSQDRKGAKDLEYWKQSQIEETAKSVRARGANIDPFDNGENTKYLQQQRRVQESIDRYRYLQRHKEGFNLDPTHKEKLGEEIKTLRGMSNKTNADLPKLRGQYQGQLEIVNKRIEDASNNVKNFFNPIDKEELSSLKSIQTELTERIRRIDGGYGVTRINTDKLSIPKSVAETFEDLHKRRVELYNQIHSETGNSNLNGKGPVKRSGIAFPQRGLSDINHSIRDTGYYEDFKVNSFSSDLASPSNTKTYRPAYGTTGYGLGLANSFAASRAEHLARGAHFMNLFGVGGASAMQAIQESFGIMNKAQRQQVAQARGFAKLGGLMVPGLAAIQLGMGIHNNDDAGQIFEDIFSVGTSLAGWRAGAAIGGGLGGSGKGVGGLIGRGLGLGIGGLTGMVTGFAVGAAVVGGVRDIMKNESEIRKFAKKAYTKEAYVSSFTTNQALTARMSSLQKLAKSGLNDRGLLLGNESSVLAGVM